MSGARPGPDDLAALLAGPVERVAPLLLGAVVSHAGVSIRLTEVEAYGGADDAGSHAHRGPTRRNATMFGPAGRLYVYLSYGLHVCANVVTGPEGSPGAVLLRAGEVVAGADEARSRRRTGVARDLARGPGRLGQALGLRLDHDGTDLLAPSTVTLHPGEPVTAVERGPRVGLRGDAERPWRFWIADEPTVSAYRKAPPLGC